MSTYPSKSIAFRFIILLNKIKIITIRKPRNKPVFINIIYIVETE